ncbi:hypothetical protein K1719_023488 [Acacia pycnantha]|nr:hypothetical protein K1719_023488 [Acacia pycnantha]
MVGVLLTGGPSRRLEGAKSSVALPVTEGRRNSVERVEPVSISLLCCYMKFPVTSDLLIRIHSPMRADPNRVVKWVPDHHTIRAARIASEKFLRFS